MKARICKGCNQEFMPKSGRQLYCKKEIVKKCPVCGDNFIIHCQPENPTTCSKPECKKKAGYIGSIAAPKKCAICGNDFKPTASTQQYCNKPIIRKCKVCGEEFTIRCTAEEYKKQTCSEECMNKLASIHRQETYMQQTKICQICGKEFHPRSNTQVVCEREHFRNCVVCGKEFKLMYNPAYGSAELRKTCSDECLHKLMVDKTAFNDPEVRQKIKETMVEKYGVENPSQNKELFEKQRATTKARYGVEFMMQSEEGKERIIKTNKEKYGVDWATQNESIKRRTIETNRMRYNSDNPMQNKDVVDRWLRNYEEKTGYSSPGVNPEVVAKRESTNLDKYGVKHVWASPEVRGKCKQTMIERYGTDTPMHNDALREKMEQTNLERYGSKWYVASEEGRKKSIKRMEELYGKKRFSQLREWKEQVMRDCTNIEEWMMFIENPETYIKENYSERPTYKRLSIDLGVTPGTVGEVILRKGLTNLIRYSYSYMEEEIKDLLESVGVRYKFHERKIIAPYEIDVFLPDYNLGIECNPTGTHNSSIPYKKMESIAVTPPSYHKMKTDLCEEKGVSLFHIFGYEWTHKRNIIESMLISRLRKSDRKIYARNCKIVEVSGLDAINFLNANHRQGSANSPIRLGLEYNGELVSLITFGKPRITIGKGKEDLSNCWELVRFCSLLNTSVVGGASKLFSYFIKEYRPERVRSFSDRAHTTGNLYSKLGFKELKRSEPGYMWVDYKTDMAYNRTSTQKHKLKSFLKDDSIDLTQSEKKIMEDHGFVQVYDSGTITWEWKLR